MKTNGLKLLGMLCLAVCWALCFLLAGLNSANSTSVSIWLNFELVSYSTIRSIVVQGAFVKICANWYFVNLASGIIISLNEDMTGLRAGILVVFACNFLGNR